MSKDEKKLKAKVDEYFEKYMCVSFDKFIENWEQTKEFLLNKDKKIERLNKEIIGLNNCIIEFHSEFCNKQAEINRLNNIINEIEKHLQNEISKGRSEYNVWLMGCYDEDREILDKLHELKGVDKE